MADYLKSPVFSSPSYWIALGVGVVGIGAVAMQERKGSGSAARVLGTGLAGDPKYARALLVVEVDPDLDHEDREELWDVVSTGSLPTLTTSEATDIDNNTWMIVASARGRSVQEEINTLLSIPVQEEINTLLSILKNMPGVVSARRI